MADSKPTETKPPKTDKATGVAQSGDYPLNHRLRAEALVKAGKKTDPDNIIGDDLIANTAARLEKAEKAAKKAAGDTPTSKES